MISQIPPWAKVAAAHLGMDETDGGTVSSKGERKFRNVCYKCKTHGHKWMQDIELGRRKNDSFLSDSSIAQRAFPKRCAKCKSRHNRWSNAMNKFVKLDELRLNEEIEHLRFVTKTRKEWVTWHPHHDEFNLREHMDELKTRCNRQARNWRHRKEWWKSKNALGQFWPECKVTGVGYIHQGKLIMGYQLQFHQHMILVSKFLDNRPIRDCCNKPCRCPKKYQGAVIDDSRFYKEWGGIVDVRAVKDWKNNYYMVKGKYRRGCGKKACVSYLSKYITKARGWSSQKIGEW